jgi:prepilin-type N-terminal cleavage/methylation domain-containing protein/prepilin-type processing-associated H-X9-DG protein
MRAPSVPFVQCRLDRSSRTHAFTLTEVLVAIGIIAILAGLLFPTFASAREAANRTKCMSNMRQLGIAFTMYLNDNRGRFPRPAQAGDRTVQVPEDWMHFQSGRDLNNGAIVKYVARPFNPALFRCPTDDVETHRTTVFNGSIVQYKFSYTVNEAICRILWNGPTLRISQIRNPSEKILIVDESATTIDDGCWAWQHAMGGGMNVMSNRHDHKTEKSADPKFGRGNVAFVDGHVSYIQRNDTFDARFWDPRR